MRRYASSIMKPMSSSILGGKNIAAFATFQPESAAATDISEPADTIDEAIQALPQELQCMILDCYMEVPRSSTVILDKDYNPPAALQITRAHRASFATAYYRDTVFDPKQDLVDKDGMFAQGLRFQLWLRSLSVEHQSLIGTVKFRLKEYLGPQQQINRAARVHVLSRVRRHVDFFWLGGRLRGTTLLLSSVVRDEDGAIVEESLSVVGDRPEGDHDWRRPVSMLMTGIECECLS